MNKALFFGCVMLVSMALVAGFMVAGGPEYARQEQADRERVLDIRRLGQFYACFGNPDDQTDVLSTTGCSRQSRRPDDVDPQTGADYRYTRVSPHAFQVCATFQTNTVETERWGIVTRGVQFTGDEGCVVFKRAGAGKVWVRQ